MKFIRNLGILSYEKRKPSFKNTSNPRFFRNCSAQNDRRFEFYFFEFIGNEKDSNPQKSDFTYKF